MLLYEVFIRAKLLISRTVPAQSVMIPHEPNIPFRNSAFNGRRGASITEAIPRPQTGTTSGNYPNAKKIGAGRLGLHVGASGGASTTTPSSALPTRPWAKRPSGMSAPYGFVINLLSKSKRAHSQTRTLSRNAIQPRWQSSLAGPRISHEAITTYGHESEISRGCNETHVDA